MLEKLNNVVNELKSTNSSKEKLNILSKYKSDPDICTLFLYTYNTFYRYGVTSANLKKNQQLVQIQFYSLIELLDMLRNREITGNEAISVVNGFINQNIEYQNLLYDIFDRNLNIGMNIKQINKALNNIIPTFDVALANIYDNNNLDDYLIQRKVNGVRLVNIITFNKLENKAEIKSYSRTGKEYTTCKNIQDELIQYYNKSKFYGQDLVFDGECCIIDKEGKEDWNSIVSEIKRKNHIIPTPKYIIFDFLSLDEFSGLKPSFPYSKRRDNMLRLFFGFNENQQFKYLDVIFSTPYTLERFNSLVKSHVETNKWEGLIFRKNCSYKSGRSNDLLKYKLFQDEEFIIKDVEITTKPMLNKDRVMEQKQCIGALIFDLKNGNTCKVGSGLSDEQRLEWFEDPSKIIGKQVLIKYKELTKNTDGTYSLLFPTLVKVFEEIRDF